MAPVGPILADIRSHSVGYPIRQGRNSTTTVQAALTLDGYGILGLPATHSSLSDPAGPTAGQSSWQGCMQGRETPGPVEAYSGGTPAPVPVQVGSPGSYTVIHGASRASRSRDWQRGTWVKPGSALLLSCLSPPSSPSTPTRPGSSHLKQPCICKTRDNRPTTNLYTRPSVCQVMYPPQERPQHWESQQE